LDQVIVVGPFQLKQSILFCFEFSKAEVMSTFFVKSQ